MSVLVFLSIDFRRLSGRSTDPGSKERLRRVNCCNRPRLLGIGSPDSTTVGAVVMMAGAGGDASGPTAAIPAVEDILVGCIAGTGGASSAACSLALIESAESEACRNLIRLKRRVLGVCSWTGVDGGLSRVSLLSASFTSFEGEQSPSSEVARGSRPSRSTDLLFLSLSARLKKLAGSRVLRRFRSRSLRPGRRALRGIALAEAGGSSTQTWSRVAQRSTWHSRGCGEVGVERRAWTRWGRKGP